MNNFILHDFSYPGTPYGTFTKSFGIPSSIHLAMSPQNVFGKGGGKTRKVIELPVCRIQADQSHLFNQVDACSRCDRQHYHCGTLCGQRQCGVKQSHVVE